MSLFDFIVPLFLGFNVWAVWYLVTKVLKPWLASRKNVDSEPQGKNGSDQ